MCMSAFLPRARLRCSYDFLQVEDPMTPVRRFQLKLLSLCTRTWYAQRERPLATVASPRPLSLLFSQRDDWQPATLKGFAGLTHKLHFAPMAQADLLRFDLIVPLTLADAHFVRSQPQHIRAHAVPLPDETCTILCDDKPRLNEALIAAGFGAHVPPMGDDLAPPFICKPARGENSDDCLLVPDYAAILRLGSALDRPGLFRQAAVRGEVEYATHFLMKDGRLERELTVAYHHDAPLYIKGSASQAPAIRILGTCPDTATLTAMLRAIGYNGMGCANFKMAAGRLQLLEINPRIGGSLMEYFATFLRSLPQARPSRHVSPSRWSWLDSVIDPPSLGAT
jgi:hypothetical protein